MYLRTSGKFGHTVANSGNPDKMAHNEHLSRIFIVCLAKVSLFFYFNN